MKIKRQKYAIWNGLRKDFLAKEGEKMEYLKLTDFIEIDFLQKIQDDYAKAVGCASITVDYRGIPITKESNFSKFCIKMRENPIYREKCHQCDAHAGLQSAINGSTHMYMCHTGLVDFSAAIKIQEHYLGAVLGGQVKLEDPSSLSPIIPVDLGFMKDPELKKLYDEIPVLSYERVSALSSMMHTVTNYIVEKQYLNKEKEELNHKRLAMLEQEREKIQFEKMLKDTELKLLYSKINSNFMFNVLNTMVRLAYVEKAKKTEEIIYDFSDMMRYSLKRTESKLTSLGDELDHIEKYLKIFRVRLGDKIDYNIQVDEKYYNIACPFMIFFPIVENFLKHVVDVRSDTGKLSVTVQENGKALHVIFKDNGNGMSANKIDNILSGKGYSNEEDPTITLYNIHKRIGYLFGDDCYGLSIESEDKPGKGLAVIVKIPLGKRRE